MIRFLAVAGTATLLTAHPMAIRGTPTPIALAAAAPVSAAAVDRYNAGTAHLNAGHPERAIDPLRQAIALQPAYADAWFNLGAAYWALDRAAEAIEAFETAHRLAPGHREALQALIHANAWLGHPEDVQRYTQALRAADARQAAELVRMGLHQRRTMTESGHWQALKAYDQALRLTDQAETRARKSLALAWLGETYERTGRAGTKLTAQALDQARRALDRQPNLPLAHVALAYALDVTHQAGSLDEARQALALAPSDAAAQWIVGRCLVGAGQPAAALAACRDAVRRDPGDARYQQALGSVLDAARQDKAAATAFQQALRLAPGYGAAAAGLAYSQLHQHDWKAAIASFRKAIALEPQDSTHRSGLGLAQYGAEQAAAALASLQQAIRQSPQTAENHYRYALVMADVGGRTLAEAAFRRAIALRPADATYQDAYRRFREGS